MCDHKASQKAHLEYHVNAIHLQLKDFKCKECQKSFVDKNHLTTHINRAHLKTKSIKKCPKCKKDFAFLSQHMKDMHNEKNREFSCDICNYVAKRKTHLTQHKNSVHLNLMRTCPHCSKEMKSSVYPEHIRMEHKNIEYTCPTCDFKTKSRGSFKSHKDSHKGKQFPCKRCGYQATRECILQRHIRVVHKIHQTFQEHENTYLTPQNQENPPSPFDFIDDSQQITTFRAKPRNLLPHRRPGQEA